MRKKSFASVSFALCIALAISPGALAYAEVGGEVVGEGGAPEVYLPENYQDPGIMPLERGQCTDTHTKAWCNAHGYRNNRPVPHAVPLNAKEKACYNKWVRAGVNVLITSTVNRTPSGVYQATSKVAEALYYCLG